MKVPSPGRAGSNQHRVHLCAGVAQQRSAGPRMVTCCLDSVDEDDAAPRDHRRANYGLLQDDNVAGTAIA